MPRPDLLLHGGPIVTLDPNAPQAEALLVRGDSIAAIGDLASVRAALRPGYETLDLRGRTALPGLCDAHIHLLWTALNAAQVNLDQAPSLERALDTIRAHAAALPAGAWVQGHGWDHSLWGGRWPTAAELDQATGGRPAYLTRKDLHSAWVNSAALRAAGIDAASPDPDGGAIGRDERGEPTGMLFERANQLVAGLIEQPDAAAKERAIAGLVGQFHRYGITGVHAPEGPDCMAAVQALHARGQLGLRVLHHLRLDLLDQAIELGLRSGLGDEWLRIGGVKIFSDGSLGSATAHMLEPFLDLPAGAPHPRGLPMLPAGELNRVVARAIGHGVSVTIHAIGDAANRGVLDAIEAAMRAHGEPLALRSAGEPARYAAHAALIPNRIEHAQIVDPADIARFGQLGVVASIQPIHATSDIDVAERMWGERCRTAYAWRSLMQAGAVLACGSDAPVESWNPWAGIHAAVTRQRPGGYPDGGWRPELCLSLEEALWGYTAGAALASGELARKGTLSPGKLADISVLDRDVFAADARDLHTVVSDVTVLGGEIVWER